MRTYASFARAIENTGRALRDLSYEVRAARWQSTDVSEKPEMRMREILNTSFSVSLLGIEDLSYWKEDIRPNLPWADNHFEERVSGVPWNPGEQWKNWPYAHSADRHRKEEGGRFSHTYMERYWPRYVGHNFFDDNWKRHGVEPLIRERERYLNHKADLRGIRYRYGDLGDVVNHLFNDPLTRQAFLPVWFPEDTGVVHRERVPCTLGYHFILRNGFFHSTYYIRSCDFVRHFRDDLYLSLRLHLWVLDQLRYHPYRTKTYKTPGEDSPEVTQALKRATEPVQKNEWWNVKPGLFTFHCVSMHCFQNDWQKLFGEK